MKNGKVVDENGDIYYYKDNKVHRKDGPAIEYRYGTKCWIENNLYHRINGPAIEWSDGDKFWYKDGKLHREDGPAIIKTSGYKSWYLNGKYYTEKNYWIKLEQLKLGIFKPFFTEEDFMI